MNENLAVIYQSFPYLIRGVIITIGLVTGALGLGFAMGIPMAVGQVYGNKYISGIISFYVWFFRGLPVLVLLFLFYFGLFSLLGFICIYRCYFSLGIKKCGISISDFSRKYSIIE